MKCIAVIPSRYYSSRFPGKLMKILGKKTIIRTTYEKIFNMNLFNEIFIVTDNKSIFDEMNNCGAKVLMSKKEHFTGTDRIAEITQNLKADVIVNVQGDEPFIEYKALKELLKIFEKDIQKNIQLCTLVYSLKNPLDIQNPDRVKVVIDKNNFALYFSRLPIPYYRENKKKVNYLGHIGVYAFRKQTLIDFANLPILDNEKAEKLECLRFLEHGYKIKVIKSTYKGIGIDSLEDLHRAQKIINNNIFI